jgi:L-malate glycosyltransferase
MMKTTSDTSRCILFVEHTSALGGAELLLLQVLEHLAPGRWEMHLACPTGPLNEAAASLGAEVHTVTLPRLRRSARFLGDWAGGVRKITSLVKAVRPVILVANTVRAMMYTAPAARLAGVPLVWYRHDFWLGESQPRWCWADRLGKVVLCSATTAIIAGSHATARLHPYPKRITVVHNGIKIKPVAPSEVGLTFRAEYGIPAGAPLVGMVGRLRPIKGQDRFLRSMAVVAKAVPSARFIVVGGEIFGLRDDYPAYLQGISRELGLIGAAGGDRVIFTGHLADPAPAMAAMDVFVQPGAAEAFGLVNVEAMAMEKPVVGFAHGGLPEIVMPGETGLLVAPGDEMALAEAVIALLRDPGRRTEMGRAGRARAVQEFNIERMVRGVEAVFAVLLAKE